MAIGKALRLTDRYALFGASQAQSILEAARPDASDNRPEGIWRDSAAQGRNAENVGFHMCDERERHWRSLSRGHSDFDMVAKL
jgi:hypothetical protein